MKLPFPTINLPPVWKERVRKWAPRVVYPLVYLFCLAVFCAVTFPYDTLKDRLVSTFNAQQRPGPGQQELQIDELTSNWITGVKAKGVRLLSLPTEAGKPPVVTSIDEAKMRISILPLIIGHRDVSFHLDAFAGEIDGSFAEHGKDRHVDVKFDTVDIGKIEQLTATLGVPLEGKLSGEVDLVMPEGKASKGTGTVDLKIDGTAIGDGKAKIKGTLALPRLVVGDLKFAAEAKEGVLRITSFGAGGKDLELSGDGRIQMRELATESVCDVNVKFKINDAYRNKDDKTKALFGAPGSNAPALFDLADAKVRMAKRPDGFYAFHVRGLLGRPDFEPQAGGGAGGGSGFGGGIGGSGGLGGGGTKFP